jgi:hypothetical protein
MNLPRTLPCLAALTTILSLPATAQSQLPRPAQLPPAGGPGQPAPQVQPAQPPAQAGAARVPPAKPYRSLAVTMPQPAADPSFEAFRKQLAEIAGRKDRAALARLVVAKSFFWDGESGDRADAKKSGMDNLAAALELTRADSYGWEVLAAAGGEPTLEPSADRKGVMCGPASPNFDEQAFEELTKSTETDAGDWGFAIQNGVEVRATAQPGAAVVEKLGMILVRILPQDQTAGAGAPPNAPPMLRIITPSGKTGFVSAEYIAPLMTDQLCYIKEPAGWKIAGYIGG